MRAAVNLRSKERASLSNDVAIFLSQGGKIEVLPYMPDVHADNRPQHDGKISWRKESAAGIELRFNNCSVTSEKQKQRRAKRGKVASCAN